MRILITHNGLADVLLDVLGAMVSTFMTNDNLIICMNTQPRPIPGTSIIFLYSTRLIDIRCPHVIVANDISSMMSSPVNNKNLISPVSFFVKQRVYSYEEVIRLY